MKTYLRSNRGVALKTIIIIFVVLTIIIMVSGNESNNRRVYREESRAKIVEYNQRVDEYNNAIKEKNKIVEMYPYIGVVFKEAKIIPESVADLEDINGIYDKMMEYQSENIEIADYNDQQLEIGKKNIEKYDLIVEEINELLNNTTL